MKVQLFFSSLFSFFNDTATTEIYTLSLHDALPICVLRSVDAGPLYVPCWPLQRLDRKSTRLNSSHLVISYAVFCLKKKKHTYKFFASRGSGTSAREDRLRRDSD